MTEACLYKLQSFQTPSLTSPLGATPRGRQENITDLVKREPRASVFHRRDAAVEVPEHQGAIRAARHELRLQKERRVVSGLQHGESLSLFKALTTNPNITEPSEKLEYSEADSAVIGNPCIGPVLL